MSAPDDPRVRLRILERLAADHARSHLRPVEAYLAEFGAWPDLVARCHAEFVGTADTGDTDAMRRCGPYRVLRPLGQGGQGAVYLARDERDGREVALKMLPGMVFSDDAGPAAVAREAEVFARLHDDRVAGVVDSGVHDGQAFLAMRYVAGEPLDRTLADWRAHPGVAPTPIARVELVIEIARALAVAHAHGVVHRDIKPSNVIVRPTGGPVLIDFGLARAIDSALPSVTRTGDVLGTPQYLSPERLRGEGRDDPRTDVWALGVTLFEVVSFALPFRGESIEAMARSIERDAVPRLRRGDRGAAALSAANPRLLRDLDAVLSKALDKRVDQRYHDAAEMGDDLQRAARGEPVSARLPSNIERARRWSAHNRAAALLIVVLGISTIAAVLAAIAFGDIADDERRARRAAIESWVRAEVDGGRLELDSTKLGRGAAALARFADAIAASRELSTPGADDDPLTAILAADFVPFRSAAANALCAWDLANEETLDIGGFGSVVATPDGDTVVFYGVSLVDRSVRMVATDVRTHRAHDVPGDLIAAHGALVAVGPDLRVLAFFQPDVLTILHRRDDATYGEPLSIRVPLRRSGAPLGPGHRGTIEAAFDPSGARLAIACADDNGGRWCVVDVAAGRSVCSDTWDGASPAWCAFAQDGKTIALPGGDARRAAIARVRILDDGGTCERSDVELTLTPHEYVLTARPLGADDLALVLRDRDAARLVWVGPDVALRQTARVDVEAGGGGDIARLSESSDGRLLAMAIGSRVLLYDLRDEALALVAAVPSAGAIELCAFEMQRTDAAGGSTLLHYRRGGRVQRLRAERRVELFEEMAPTEPEPAESVVLRRPRGPSAAGARPRMQFVNALTQQRLTVDNEGDAFGIDREVRAGDWAGARLVWFTASAVQAAIVVFARADGRVVFERPIDGMGRGGAIGVRDDGRRLAEITGLGELSLFDVTTGAELLRLEGLGAQTTHLRFDGDGDLIQWRTGLGPRRVRILAVRDALAASGIGW